MEGSGLRDIVCLSESQCRVARKVEPLIRFVRSGPNFPAAAVPVHERLRLEDIFEQAHGWR